LSHEDKQPRNAQGVIDDGGNLRLVLLAGDCIASIGKDTIGESSTEKPDVSTASRFARRYFTDGWRLSDHRHITCAAGTCVRLSGHIRSRRQRLGPDGQEHRVGKYR
jgi:hypothetical protein